jgi:uncharacterized protein YqjF (DUF2071 family)
VLGARVFTGLKYFAAEMTASRGEWIDYSWRRWGTTERGRYVYRGIGELTDSALESLEFFLLERYYLFAQWPNQRLNRGQIAHAPYRYRAAEVAEHSLGPASLDGFAEISGQPIHACFVDGFDVNIYAQEKV